MDIYIYILDIKNLVSTPRTCCGKCLFSFHVCFSKQGDGQVYFLGANLEPGYLGHIWDDFLQKFCIFHARVVCRLKNLCSESGASEPQALANGQPLCGCFKGKSNMSCFLVKKNHAFKPCILDCPPMCWWNMKMNSFVTLNYTTLRNCGIK